MIRVVIDTNVLVSAMISLSGNEALLLLAVKQGFMKPCFSPAALEETRKFSRGQSSRFPRTKLRRLSTCFTVRAIWCTLTRYPECLPTPRMTSSWLDPSQRRQISWSRATSRISRKLDWETHRS